MRVMKALSRLENEILNLERERVGIAFRREVDGGCNYVVNNERKMVSECGDAGA